MILGDELREIRHRLGITQEQLAHRLGVSFATVNRWEGGHHHPHRPMLRLIEKLKKEAMTMSATKEYLGDGVYADVREGNLVLTTENGIAITNTIYLEPEVIVSLRDYLIRRKELIGV